MLLEIQLLFAFVPAILHWLMTLFSPRQDEKYHLCQEFDDALFHEVDGNKSEPFMQWVTNMVCALNTTRNIEQSGFCPEIFDCPCLQPCAEITYR